MQEAYEIPAFVLTLLLLPGLGYLWLRFRDRRALLWFFGFLLAIVRTALHSHGLVLWDFSDHLQHPWLNTLGEIAAHASAVLFIISLAPAHAYLNHFRLPLPVLYLLPVAVYSVLYIGILHEHPPGARMTVVYLALAACSAAVAVIWALGLDEKRRIPRAGILVLVVILIVRAVTVYILFGPDSLLVFAECAAHFMTAILLILLGRRFSPGIMLGAIGFSFWALAIVADWSFISPHPEMVLLINRCVVMGKVLAAMGLLLFALEEELAVNTAAQSRERRLRSEFEAYAAVALSGRRMADFDLDAPRICGLVARNSRFSQAALLLQRPDGIYRLGGSAGLHGSIAAALDALARRIPLGKFLAPGELPAAVAGSEAVRLDLERWLKPGDDLRSLHFTSAIAVPMRGQSVAEGALLLAGMRGEEPLTTDDLLPAEILIARLQAVRSQTRMHEQLVDAEKFAVLGQLSGNVAQQLHNPLTVILGYGSLLAESTRLDAAGHKGAEAILSSARAMRATLESLHRVVRAPGSQLTTVSVTEILTDMEQLYRPEFQRRSIEFRMSIAPNLPDAVGQPQPLRQAVLHALQFAMSAVETGNGNGRSVRVEATAEGGHVQILVAHSGAAFEHPERAFDPYANSRPTSAESTGLSLCASLIRESNGRASAVNLDSQGAAILLELREERRKKPR
jgi:signal transduction histidine kinase